MCTKKLGKFRDKEWLEHRYLVDRLTARQIAKEMGVVKRTVLLQLHKFDIPLRAAAPEKVPGKFRDKSWMIHQYVTLGKSSNKIAKETGSTHHTIVRQLKAFGISVRRNTRVMYADHPLNSKKEFEHWYLVKGLSIAQIASKFNIDRHTVGDWRNAHGIAVQKAKGPRHPKYRHGAGSYASKCIDCGRPVITKPIPHRCYRCVGAYRSKVQRGEKSGNYKGIVDVAVHIRSWLSDNWTQLVFQRDDYTCCLCGRKKSIQAHHLVSVAEIVTRVIQEHRHLDLKTIEGRTQLINAIVQDKQFRDIENGITLCNKCHGIFHGRKQIGSKP